MSSSIPRAALSIAAIVTVAACNAARDAEAVASTNGRLVIVGGALRADNEDVYRPILDTTEGPGPFCVIPTASGAPEESMASAIEAFRLHGATTVDGIFVTENNPEAAADSAVVERLSACSGFWFTGGQQSRVTDVFLPDGHRTPGYDALMDRFAAGAVVAGTSAGAAMMPTQVIAGGQSAEALANGVVDSGAQDGVIIEDGMDFYDGALVDQHFLARGRIGRLLVATLAGVAGGIGLGIDENTAVSVEPDGQARVVGASGAILVDARSADRNEADNGGRGIVLYLAGSGDAIDMSTLRVTPHSVKTPVPTVGGAVQAPEDPFARWAFLHLLADFAASEQESVETSGAGYVITLEKAPGFRAVSYGSAGVQDTPFGLSVGPLLVSLVPDG